MKKLGEVEAGPQVPAFQSQVIFLSKPNIAYYFRDPLHPNFQQGHNTYKTLMG